MKKLLISLVVVSLIVPQVTLAAWWNPFSWFKKITPQLAPQAQVGNAENQVVETQSANRTASTSLGVFTIAAEPKLTSKTFTKSLYFGMTDPEVKNLQILLAKDKSIYPEGKVSGEFDTATRKAVQRFQDKYNLATPAQKITTNYGAVGPKTREMLITVFGEIKPNARVKESGLSDTAVTTGDKVSDAVTPTPPEMIGVWIFDEMLGLTVSNETIAIKLERIPLGLQVLKITKDGFCSNPTYQPSGDEMGILCEKYLAASYSESSMKLHKDYIWIESFGGFKEDASFVPRKGWPKPNAYRVKGDTLELIVKSDDNIREFWIYKFHKHHLGYTGGALTLRADREIVNPGEDIVLSGTAPVGSIIRFYGGSFVTVNCTAPGYCSSPPIVSKGKQVPYPPANHSERSGGYVQRALSQDEQYFDCPWPESQIPMSLPGGVFASTETLCVTPDAAGAFEVRFFNEGVNTSSLADHYEGTYYAKLANEPGVKHITATFLSCKRFPNMTCKYGDVLQRK